MTKTEDDLKAAFAGESQANRKYLAFSKKAAEEGYKGVSLLFKAIAEAETVHAMNHLKIFGLGSTEENLKAAIKGENYEVTTMYPDFLEDAEAENHKNAIKSFKYAAEAEKIHERYYMEALANLSDNKDYEVDKVSVCPVCGHTIIGDPPEHCPVCGCKDAKYMIFE